MQFNLVWSLAIISLGLQGYNSTDVWFSKIEDDISLKKDIQARICEVEIQYHVWQRYKNFQHARQNELKYKLLDRKSFKREDAVAGSYRSITE